MGLSSIIADPKEEPDSPVSLALLTPPHSGRCVCFGFKCFAKYTAVALQRAGSPMCVVHGKVPCAFMRWWGHRQLTDVPPKTQTGCSVFVRQWGDENFIENFCVFPLSDC